MIDYIIYITDKNILNVSSQKDFSQKYKFSISENFIPLTSSIVTDKGNLKYPHKILDIPTCLCKKYSANFLVGIINGFIQKINILFQKGNETQSIKDEEYILE